MTFKTDNASKLNLLIMSLCTTWSSTSVWTWRSLLLAVTMGTDTGEGTRGFIYSFIFQTRINTSVNKLHINALKIWHAFSFYRLRIFPAFFKPYCYIPNWDNVNTYANYCRLKIKLFAFVFSFPIIFTEYFGGFLKAQWSAPPPGSLAIHLTGRRQRDPRETHSFTPTALLTTQWTVIPEL